MRDFSNWNSHVFRKAVVREEMPEYLYLFDSKGNQIPHDSPYHIEDIFDHVCMVIDAAASLSKRFNLNEQNHNELMIAATWHDCGKIFARREKERLVCLYCGKPFSVKHSLPCSYCHHNEFSKKIVHGYEHHERIGASNWLWGNISKREEIPADISLKVKNMIFHHLRVMTAVIQNKEDYPFDLVSVLLSWADSEGRIKPKFDLEVSENFKVIARRLSNA